MCLDDLAIVRFLAFKPWQYSYLEHLDLFSGFGDEDELSLNILILKLELLSNTYEENLRVVFQGVKNLHMIRLSN